MAGRDAHLCGDLLDRTQGERSGLGWTSGFEFRGAADDMVDFGAAVPTDRPPPPNERSSASANSIGVVNRCSGRMASA